MRYCVLFEKQKDTHIDITIYVSIQHQEKGSSFDVFDARFDELK